MNEERYKLEKELKIIEQKLDKEKSKRNIVMVILSSILCGFVLSIFSDNFDTSKSIISLIFISIISGTILYFISISVFAAITDLFTDIPHLKDRKSALEEKLHQVILNGK